MTPPMGGGRLAPAAPDKKKVITDGAFTTNPLVKGDWSVSFVAFICYTFAVVTFKLPIGTASMVVAMLGLPLEGRPLRMPKMIVLAVCLIGWAFIGAILTDYPDHATQDIQEFAKIALVSFVGINVLVTRSRVRIYLLCFVVFWGLYPIRGTLFDHFIAHADVDGRSGWRMVYENPNDLAGLSLLALGASAGLAAAERKNWVMWGARLAVGCLLLIVMLTASRGAMIALTVFAITYGWKYMRNTRNIVRGLLVLSVAAALAPNTLWKRLTTLQNAADTSSELYDAQYVDDLSTRADQASSAQRIAIWNVAIHIIAENPVVGVGIGTYPWAHYAMFRRGGFDPLAYGRRDTHSTYLNVAAETGIPGLVLFLAMTWTVISDARKARRLHGARAPALSFQLFNIELGLWAYLVAGIWGSYGFFLYTYLHFTLLAAMTYVMNEEATPAHLRGGVQRGRMPAQPAQFARVAS